MMRKKVRSKFFWCMIMINFISMSACSKFNVAESKKVSSLYLKAEKAYFDKRYTLAKDYYNTVLRYRPDTVGALFRLGNINMHEKNWNEARVYYSRVLKIQPGHEKSRYNITILHLYHAKKHMVYYTQNFDSIRSSAMHDLLREVDAYSKNSNVSTSSLKNKSDNKFK